MRPVLTLRLAAAALLLAACDDPTAPRELPRHGAPDAFSLSGSWFGSGTTSITLAGAALRYEHRPWGWRSGEAVDSATVVPDSAAWAAFWATARRVGLETWPRECADRAVVDGGGYTVDVEFGGRRLRTVASNASPGANGRCDRGTHTPDEEELLRAVRILVRRPFPGRLPAVRLPTEGRPQSLRVQAGAVFDGSSDVTLRGDTLVVERRPYFPLGTTTTTTTRVVPTAEAWRAFWASLARSGVAYWPAECRDPMVQDGGWISIDLGVVGGHLQRSVQNALPTLGGECSSWSARPADAEDTIAAVYEAVSRLVGRPIP